MNAQQRNQAYLTEMNKIIELFDGSAYQEELEARQLLLLKAASTAMSAFQPENFLGNFEEEAQPEWEEFCSTGLVMNGETQNSINTLKAILAVNTKKLSKVFITFEDWARENPRKGLSAAAEVDIEADLAILNTLYPYDPELKGWRLPDFELSPDNTGDKRTQIFSGLIIQLDFAQDSHQKAIKIIPDKKKTTMAGGYFHPHVSSTGGVCWGESDKGVQEHWQKKKLMPLLHLLCAMLDTYNSGSPYQILETWISREAYNCSNCGLKIYDDTAVFIEGNSEIPACKACAGELGRDSGIWRWNHELVHSNMRGGNILKRDASRVWLNDTDRDHLPNILSSPHFSICQGGCMSWIHNDYLLQEDGRSKCIRCRRGTEV